MSFLRFLAVGQSIDAVIGATPKYRMTEQGLLPRFGKESQKAEAKVVPASEGIAMPPQKKVFTGKQMSGHSIAGQTQRQAGGRSIGFWGCVRRLFNPRRRHRPGVAIQPELALESIKPVCNDLTDSDLDVIPAPRKSKVSGNEILWKRMRVRMFKMRQA